MPAKSSKGESKQGLIITLVFFILATIGLGVATYFGFADQEAKDKAVKKAEGERGIFQDQRNWYQFQSQMYRSWMGQAQNIDLADLGVKKGHFDSGAMKGDKDKEDVTKLIKDSEKRFGWKDNKPERTYEDLLKEANDKYKDLANRNQASLAALKKAEADIKKRDEMREEAKKEYATNLNKFRQDNTKDQSNDRKTIDELRNEVARLGIKYENDKKTSDKKEQDLGKQINALKGEIKHYQELVKARNEEIAIFKLKGTDAPPSMRTDWRILRMDVRGTNPYINLGSADKVKPQLTFSIHGMTLDGRPIPQAKGTLEVVNVINDHLSQARITSVVDARRDPILKGDVLYNPSWNPTIKKHVALAGIIDLTGDGRDSLPEFMRNLERQNIVVDAWLDPKDFSIKGKLTVRTDFLIIGESLEFQRTGREKNPEFQKKLDAGISQMKSQAASNGVAVLSLSKYLEMIGYRLPRSVGEDRPSLYNPAARPDLTPPKEGDKRPMPPPAK